MPNTFIKEDEDPEYDILISANDVVIYLDLRWKELEYNRVSINIDGNKIYVTDSMNNRVIKVISLPIRIDPLTLTYKHKNGIFILQGNKLN
ncbi:hypothetical protein [Saccharolobus islandicus]|uniref:Uncharacterized protein n=4 Tax=Saccharolobus islandicus TaxID=43080 RepID=M9UA82_SACIS|nr:hypothetical protein [Sulfolobus islandicus]ACR42305.1 hypothetical protein M164_1701 [Sulfolobus islandicus M.16.4]ADX82975.1 hypothetical protein SiH_1627 [Sulfolobus islandicus HVE10/4]ADX85613.1 hypothetical protein SiRe_1549 [Sulfolobus islandicus REY15A]AGJ62988.1 Hypothetical Protein SiL_1542 [Sulfolobus islandicus LAL14/1]WCM38235.1 hypothetical protein GO599_12790 [Sulfolobus islandicus]